MSQSPEKPAERRKANPERRGGIELDRSAKAFGKPPRLHQNKMNIRTAIQRKTTRGVASIGTTMVVAFFGASTFHF
jgi:hypothetical protein